MDKTSAVHRIIAYAVAAENIHVGASDYVPWLKDRKWCHIRMEGTTFGDVPLNLELKLEVWDSPNSAGVVIDAVRCARLALDHGMKGALIGPSAYFKKSPPLQFPDEIAREMTEAFIRNPAADLKHAAAAVARARAARTPRAGGGVAAAGNGGRAAGRRPAATADRLGRAAPAAGRRPAERAGRRRDRKRAGRVLARSR